LARPVIRQHGVMTAAQAYAYVVWIRDPTLPTDDEDYEWPAGFIVRASSAEEAQAWGDRLAMARCAEEGDVFLHSTVERASEPGAYLSEPVIPYGYEASRDEIGW